MPEPKEKTYRGVRSRRKTAIYTKMDLFINNWNVKMGFYCLAMEK